MHKKEFLQELEEIVDDKIFIGSNLDYLDDEISNNTWSISMKQKLVNEFKVEDLIDFFSKVIQNRKEQIINSKYNHGMLFYVWFDRFSARLRFNLISDFHTNLPFGGDIQIIDIITPIIEEFLNFPYHDGLVIEESDVVEESTIELVEPVKVYLQRVR